jgi:phosphoribosylformylglycinamidine synthase
VAAVQEVFAGLPLVPLGRRVKEPRLRIVGASGQWVVWAYLADVKEAWQKPLRW